MLAYQGISRDEVATLIAVTETPDPDVPAVMNSTQLAELLSISEQVVRMWAREGALPAHRPPGGRKFTFLRDENFAWLVDSMRLSCSSIACQHCGLSGMMRSRCVNVEVFTVQPGSRRHGDCRWPAMIWLQHACWCSGLAPGCIASWRSVSGIIGCCRGPRRWPSRSQ